MSVIGEVHLYIVYRLSTGGPPLLVSITATPHLGLAASTIDRSVLRLMARFGILSQFTWVGSLVPITWALYYLKWKLVSSLWSPQQLNMKICCQILSILTFV